VKFMPAPGAVCSPGRRVTVGVHLGGVDWLGELANVRYAREVAMSVRRLGLFGVAGAVTLVIGPVAGRTGWN